MWIRRRCTCVLRRLTAPPKSCHAQLNKLVSAITCSSFPLIKPKREVCHLAAVLEAKNLFFKLVRFLFVASKPTFSDHVVSICPRNWTKKWRQKAQKENLLAFWPESMSRGQHTFVRRKNCFMIKEPWVGTNAFFPILLFDIQQGECLLQIKLVFVAGDDWRQEQPRTHIRCNWWKGYISSVAGTTCSQRNLEQPLYLWQDEAIPKHCGLSFLWLHMSKERKQQPPRM